MVMSELLRGQRTKAQEPRRSQRLKSSYGAKPVDNRLCLARPWLLRSSTRLDIGDGWHSALRPPVQRQKKGREVAGRGLDWRETTSKMPYERLF